MNTFIDTPSFSVADLRHKTVMLLKQVSEKGYVYVLRRSRPEIALITVEYLRALQEAYGDYLDTLEFDKTVGLKRVPLVKYKRQMVGE